MTNATQATKHVPRVRDYMTPMPYTVGRAQTLDRAHQLMQKHKIRHLPVLEGGELVGIVSERDLYFIETLRNVDRTRVMVEEAMTQVPYVVTADTPLEEVARVMAEHHYGSAVIMTYGTVVGVFTTVDAMRALATMLVQ